MITAPRDYFNLYHRIQSENAPSTAILLPTDEKIYLVDLNTRTVEAPKYLSVERDHKAEVIYFKVNRYYDFYDLTQSVCVIQYINGANEPRAYVVPFYDIDTLGGKGLSENEEDIPMMLFPWVIDREATKAGGDITFSIKFYKLTDTGRNYLYNLTTLPATSKILEGIKIDDTLIKEEEEYLVSEKEKIYQAIHEAKEVNRTRFFWEESYGSSWEDSGFDELD